MAANDDGHDVLELIKKLTDCLPEIPTLDDRRARWSRGFGDGYRGRPYKADTIPEGEHYRPVVYSPDPYRMGFFAGLAARN